MATKKVNIDIIAKDKSRRALGQVRSRLDRIKKSAFSVKGALAGIGAALVIRKIVAVSAEFEDLRDSLSSVTGSVEKGQEAFNFIKDFATRTQFSVQQLTRSFITLKASGIQPTEELLRTFTDTAAVTTDQIGVLDAMTRVFSRGIQGGLGLEELNQIADRGIPVWRIMEEQLGITRLEIAKFGQTTEVAKKILDALQEGLNKEFGGATETKMDNLSTAMSNFGIAVDNSADAFGQGGFSGALTNAINQGSRFIAWLEPLIFLLGKLTGLIITVLVWPFEQLGNAVAFATEKGSEFLQWLGITKKLADEVAISTDDTEEAMKDLGKAIEVAENKTFDLNAEMKKQVEANKKVFESIKERNLSEYELIDERMNKELALVEKQERLLATIRDDAITNNLMDERMANAIYLAELKKFAGLKEMIMLEAAQERLKIIEDELDEAFALQQAHYNKNLQALKNYQFQKINLEELTQEQIKELQIEGGRQLLSELAKMNRTMFMLDKALRIRQAYMNTAAGVTRALATGNIPMAMLIGGLGAVQIATIAQQKYTGRQLGGQVKAGQPYMVGEAGKELFVPSQDGKIVANHDLGKPVTVNFNINTVDARGFNELLVNSRGVIVNMINSAVNEKGKVAII